MIGEGSAEDNNNNKKDEDEENAATGDATATIIATSSSELVRDKHFPAMRAAIIGLCKGRKFMDVVQDGTDRHPSVLFIPGHHALA